MKKSKKIIIAIIAILIICMGVVNATVLRNNFKLSLKASKQELKKGDEFTIELIANENDVNCNIIQGKLEYDENVLELVTMNNEENDKDVKIVKTSSNNNCELIATTANEVLATKDDAFKDSIGKITFKVKDNANSRETKIILKDIKGTSLNDQPEDITSNPLEITVKVKSDNTLVAIIVSIAAIIILIMIIIIIRKKAVKNKI